MSDYWLVADVHVHTSEEVRTSCARSGTTRCKRLASHRGGPELYSTIRRAVDDDALLEHWSANGALWTIGDERGTTGLRASCATTSSRGSSSITTSVAERVATTLLTELMAGERPPKDGYALPGRSRDEVAVRVPRLEGPTPYDARRVGGRRVVGRRGILVGGGGGGTFMPSNFANSGMAPALWIATALHDSSLGMPWGLTLRRMEVSTVNSTISFQSVGSASALRASEVIATTLAAISALTRVDMSGGRATSARASFTFFDSTAASSFVVPLRSQVLQPGGQ